MIEKKKILLVSNGFYPEISPRSYRATELAKEFLRRGHEVTLISKFRDFDYSEFLKGYPIKIKMWSKPGLPEIPVLKQKPLSLLSRGVKRILALLIEYPGIEEMFQVKKILEHERGYDLLISFAVPHPVHWGVAWSESRRHRIAEVWIADCGDPYMGNILDTFKKPFYFKYFEKWFCRKADFISIPIESALPAYYPEFHHKIKIIPQGFDFDLDSKKSENPVNDIPAFAYAGSFLPGTRDPEALLNFLAGLDKPFRFYVFTNKPDLFDAYSEKLNGKLKVSGYIPRSDLLQVLSKMDFLVNFDNNTTLNSPSKLIDYAIVNRPVLNIEHKFDQNRFDEFLTGDYRNQMHLPSPDKYHIKNVAKLFLDLVKDFPANE